METDPLHSLTEVVDARLLLLATVVLRRTTVEMIVAADALKIIGFLIVAGSIKRVHRSLRKWLTVIFTF